MLILIKGAAHVRADAVCSVVVGPDSVKVYVGDRKLSAYHHDCYTVACRRGEVDAVAAEVVAAVNAHSS